MVIKKATRKLIEAQRKQKRIKILLYVCRRNYDSIIGKLVIDEMKICYILQHNSAAMAQSTYICAAFWFLRLCKSKFDDFTTKLVFFSSKWVLRSELIWIFFFFSINSVNHRFKLTKEMTLIGLCTLWTSKTDKFSSKSRVKRKFPTCNHSNHSATDWLGTKWKKDSSSKLDAIIKWETMRANDFYEFIIILAVAVSMSMSIFIYFHFLLVFFPVHFTVWRFCLHLSSSQGEFIAFLLQILFFFFTFFFYFFG